MASQIKNRGRAYQCKKCTKILRRGRMIGHILKHHLSMDRVPYSCTLCMFRCQEQKTLVDHITKYKRHVDMEKKLGFKPNYAEILKRAVNPYIVGENDMTQLDKEVSYKWHGRNLVLAAEETSDDVFAEEGDEDETVMVGGLALPRWAVEEQTPTNAGYVPTPIQQLRQDLSQVPETTTIMQSTPSVFRSTISKDPISQSGQTGDAPTMQDQYPTINLQDWENTIIQPSLQLAPPSNSSHISSLVTVTNSNLKIPVIHIASPSTRCQDENILPSLLGQDEMDGFLTLEPIVPSSNEPEHQVEEPPKKKARYSETS